MGKLSKRLKQAANLATAKSYVKGVGRGIANQWHAGAPAPPLTSVPANLAAQARQMASVPAQQAIPVASAMGKGIGHGQTVGKPVKAVRQWYHGLEPDMKQDLHIMGGLGAAGLTGGALYQAFKSDEQPAAEQPAEQPPEQPEGMPSFFQGLQLKEGSAMTAEQWRAAFVKDAIDRAQLSQILADPDFQAIARRPEMMKDPKTGKPVPIEEVIRKWSERTVEQSAARNAQTAPNERLPAGARLPAELQGAVGTPAPGASGGPRPSPGRGVLDLSSATGDKASGPGKVIEPPPGMAAAAQPKPGAAIVEPGAVQIPSKRPASAKIQGLPARMEPPVKPQVAQIVPTLPKAQQAKIPAAKPISKLGSASPLVNAFLEKCAHLQGEDLARAIIRACEVHPEVKAEFEKCGLEKQAVLPLLLAGAGLLAGGAGLWQGHKAQQRSEEMYQEQKQQAEAQQAKAEQEAAQQKAWQGQASGLSQAASAGDDKAFGSYLDQHFKGDEYGGQREALQQMYSNPALRDHLTNAANSGTVLGSLRDQYSGNAKTDPRLAYSTALNQLQPGLAKQHTWQDPKPQAPAGAAPAPAPQAAQQAPAPAAAPPATPPQAAPAPGANMNAGAANMAKAAMAGGLCGPVICGMLKKAGPGPMPVKAPVPAVRAPVPRPVRTGPSPAAAFRQPARPTPTAPVKAPPAQPVAPAPAPAPTAAPAPAGTESKPGIVSRVGSGLGRAAGIGIMGGMGYQMIQGQGDRNRALAKEEKMEQDQKDTTERGDQLSRLAVGNNPEDTEAYLMSRPENERHALQQMLAHPEIRAQLGNSGTAAATMEQMRRMSGKMKGPDLHRYMMAQFGQQVPQEQVPQSPQQPLPAQAQAAQPKPATAANQPMLPPQLIPGSGLGKQGRYLGPVLCGIGDFCLLEKKGGAGSRPSPFRTLQQAA